MSLTAVKILALREENKDMREREFAKSIGISEAELVEAYCANGSTHRIRVDVPTFLNEAVKLGEVMALTRNEGAVNERIGHFQKIIPGENVSLTLGEIDLRIFQNNWKFGFVREMHVHDRLVKSFQFFDAYGEAVFKLYPKAETNVEEWDKLIKRLAQDSPKESIQVLPLPSPESHEADIPNIEEFRERWEKMTDVHQLHNILKEFNISRYDAVKFVGEKFANPLDKNAIEKMFEGAVEHKIPIMCFVGNRGCIQIFTGKVEKIQMYGAWFNVLDEKFNLHLLTTEIDKIWHVRKPTSDGYVSSLEAFNRHGDMIIQFFGERKEGTGEREDWRSLLSTLPALKQMAVA
ncbi:hemin-degrading factor [Bartonella tamiae]|uniref:Haemin-degrading HemS/ChuX domain-containing protein n=1 Tax=Bartonella tamiae Th239 TaxID=1094558 RepID=J0R4M3_9HYPH|nr:hemin-degrading factor [Bartonella tamiae]EJF90614.1 hypothetical protein ME5_01015 [Bartonella tamiae Th239]EJF94008.1 hypothetical protein MEG_00866 [Bartonella tamiae Th307]